MNPVPVSVLVLAVLPLCLGSGFRQSYGGGGSVGYGQQQQQQPQPHSGGYGQPPQPVQQGYGSSSSVHGGGYGYQKTTKCYQCAYSPDKYVVRDVKHPVQVKDPYNHYGGYKTVYQTRQVKERLPGGWDKCLGPFDHYQAKAFGVDVWDCHDNCFTRVDKSGNVIRGCYKGEYGVNPNYLGCNIQAGDLYCFCKGDKCNNEAAPYFPAGYDH